MNKKDLVRTIVVYFMQQIKEKDVNVNRAIRERPTPVKEFIMSTYDMILQKGMQEGVEKKAIITIANMLDALEIPTEQIARLTGVDIAMVELVQNKITSGEWATLPEHWTEEEWAAYFNKMD